MRFDELYQKLLLEAEQPPAPPSAGGTAGTAPTPNEETAGEGDMSEEMPPDEFLDDDPVSPEELELAKLAIRAMYFNTDSKDVHQFSLKDKGNKIPFEEIPDYFEETKRWQPIIAFVEYVMDKFEGFSSKWSEQPEIRGRKILDKIKHFNKNVSEEEKLDNGKRLYWVRIIINCMLHGRPTENLTIGDVNEVNIKEIFDMLKMHYGNDTRGIMPGKNIRAPGVF